MAEVGDDLRQGVAGAGLENGDREGGGVGPAPHTLGHQGPGGSNRGLVAAIDRLGGGVQRKDARDRDEQGSGGPDQVVPAWGAAVIWYAIISRSKASRRTLRSK
ncbi:MAG: hypothetical protein NVS9B1_16970 [Candidatus Dormibacteraceae bacterium]